MSRREPVYGDVRGRVWEFEGRREEFKGWRDEFKGGERRRTEMFAGGSRKRSLKGGERGVPECSQECLEAGCRNVRGRLEEEFKGRTERGG